MTYGDGRWLHHYLTMKNTETEVIRGDQEMAVDELYAILAHTSSTHAGFEFAVLAWGDRDFGFNLMPHGWFAAKYRALLRDMLVREQGRELHLASTLSPEWAKPGHAITVKRAPTYFGQVNYRLEFANDGATLRLDNQFTEAPQDIVVHVPWWAEVHNATADGKAVAARDGNIVVPAGTKTLQLQWTRRELAKPYSYEAAVREYRAEYARRYAEFLKTGKRDAQN